jgi:hypothetical protein
VRSFLLIVHEPGSAVLEDLRTRRRVRVADLAEVPARVGEWLAEGDDGDVVAPDPAAAERPVTQRR